MRRQVTIPKDLAEAILKRHPNLTLPKAVKLMLEDIISPLPPKPEPKPEPKSKANRAREVARKVYPFDKRPKTCVECGSAPPTERHHVVPIRELIRKNIHLNEKAHRCIWVCHSCHEKLEGRTFPNINKYTDMHG